MQKEQLILISRVWEGFHSGLWGRKKLVFIVRGWNDKPEPWDLNGHLIKCWIFIKIINRNLWSGNVSVLEDNSSTSCQKKERNGKTERHWGWWAEAYYSSLARCASGLGLKMATAKEGEHLRKTEALIFMVFDAWFHGTQHEYIVYKGEKKNNFWSVLSINFCLVPNLGSFHNFSKEFPQFLTS